MRLQLWGIGTQSKSRAITAQRRINCMVDIRQDADRSNYAAIGRFGLSPFVSNIGSISSRGLWAVNTRTAPILFVVQGASLKLINAAGVASTIGTLATVQGSVSMADDGTYLVIVDGSFGYVYNMNTAVLTTITDGNFTTSPSTVTWLDGYFIVTSANSRQFQLSQITPSIDPTVWPSVQINFAGSGPGNLRAGIVNHSILMLYSDTYTEFWQDAGSPDFPFALMPGSAQQFGLAAPFSLAQFDNSLVGLFQNNQGGVSVGRMAGFSFKRLSDVDIEQILSSYSVVFDAKGYSVMIDGHPLYIITFPGEGHTWMYDGLSNIWSELQAPDGSQFWGDHFANFVGRPCITDRRNGNIYHAAPTVYADNGSGFPVELISKHIWNDDKYVGIKSLQVDVEAGAQSVTVLETPVLHTDINIVLSATYTPTFTDQWVSDGGVIVSGSPLVRVGGIPAVGQYAINNTTHTFTFNVADFGNTANISYYLSPTSTHAPVLDLHVSKDGGNSFFPVGFSSIGAVGEYTQRVKWNSLGAARDWVLKLRITDPVKVVLTGASVETTGAPF